MKESRAESLSKKRNGTMCAFMLVWARKRGLDVTATKPKFDQAVVKLNAGENSRTPCSVASNVRSPNAWRLRDKAT